MRGRSLIAISLALATLSAATLPAAAGDWLFWRREKGPYDPYVYRPEPRNYYPYYNSGYWVPDYVVRAKPKPIYVLPPYYQAWGYPREYRYYGYEEGPIK